MTNNYLDNGRLYPNSSPPSVVVSGGWIYLLMTKSDGGRVKIGKTKNNPIERLAKLRCGDPYLAMIGAFFIPESMGQIKHIERWIHDWFEGCRIRFTEHIRPNGNIPAHRLDDRNLIAHSEWFSLDVMEALDHLRNALLECLEVDQIFLASWYSPGAYPTDLAFYSQEMLLEMFGNPINIDDDYDLGDQPDGRIPW